MLLLTPVAAARAQEVSRGLSYQADPSCLDERAFATLVLEHTPAADLSPLDPAHAGVVVVLRATEDMFVGQLQIRRRDGTRFGREVRDASCTEVAQAIAFIVGLALSGQAENAPPEPPPPAPPAPARTAPAPVAPPDAAPVQTPPQLGFGFGAAIGARSGIAPTWALTESAAIEARSLAKVTLAPSFRLAVLHAGTVTVDSGVGTTDFSLIAGRAAGCPLRLPLTSGIDLLPCLGVDVGSIGASGQPATPQGSSADTRSVWVDIFASLRPQFRLVGPLYAELEAELVVPLTTYQFAFDPGTNVYRVPTLAAAGSAGLFLLFP
jgi:hypothetical protein